MGITESFQRNLKCDEFDRNGVECHILEFDDAVLEFNERCFTFKNKLKHLTGFH